MNYHFFDVVDEDLFHNLMDAFYRATGIVHGLIDPDGNILSGIGWYDICTKFHRACPETLKRCQESDRFTHQVYTESTLVEYRCLNGLIEMGIPIVIDGQHLATIMLGQFFFEPPDIAFFHRQAKQFGFDEEAYLDALAQVPIMSREKVDAVMDFYAQLARLLATLGVHQRRSQQIREELESRVSVRTEELSMVNQLLRRELEERDKARHELILSNQRFAKTFYQNPAPMFIISALTGRYIDVNDSFVEATGFPRDQIVGHTPRKFSILETEASRGNIAQQIKENGSLRDLETNFINVKKGERIGLLSFNLITVDDEDCMLGTLVDITERRLLEREVARLDRLNLVGQMAASIGHEVRNPMTTVRGFLQMMRENPLYEQERDYFNLMIEELDMGNAIITEFLSLARDKKVQLVPTKIGTIVKAMFPLINARAVAEDKQVALELNDVDEVLLDINEIQQVLINMSNNGLEAMAPGGTLLIAVRQHNDEVILAVEDQGEGINAEHLEKLGTPFFTTKDTGTGMGLAICYGVAARHGAHIKVSSDSKGTVFQVCFPRYQQAKAEGKSQVL